MFSNKNSLCRIFLTLSSILLYTYSQACKKYICGKLENSTCLIEDNTITPSTITGQLCQNTSEICPNFKLTAGGKVLCEKQAKTIKQYPGGPCKTADDCFYNLCSNNTCTGGKDGESCDLQNCIYNRSCFKLNSNSTNKSCNPYRSSGDKCTEETECPLSHGCFNGVCTAYFSLGNDVDVKLSSNNNSYSFCASGYDIDGICQVLQNLDEFEQPTENLVKCSAKKECKYKLANGNVITKTDVCDTCGKSKDGNIYCPAYGGSKLYSRWVKYINSTLSSEFKRNCNTVERTGACNFYKSDMVLNKDYIEKINTYEVRQKYFQTFANAEDCIVQIFNPFYNPKVDNPVDPVPTDEPKCPLFKCSSDDRVEKKICANQTFDLNLKRSNISLFSKSCAWGKEKCDFNPDYNNKNPVDFKCANSKPKLGKSFPGESCDGDDDCFAETKTDKLGKCDNKTNLCLGYQRGENCTKSSECVKSLFCKNNLGKLTCESQLGKDQNCTLSYDCMNSMACVNKTCKDAFFSLDVGAEVSDSYDVNIARENFCKNKIVRKTADAKVYCATKNQTDVRNSSEGDLVRCNLGQMCNYTITDGKNSDFSQVPCDCGYNKYGYGYCPRGQNSRNNFFYQICKFF